jgi:hypothetical protein
MVLSGGQIVRQQAGVVGHEEMEAWLKAAAGVAV